MKKSARYAKIIEWSEEDQCYVGSSPGLIYGGCHGFDEKAVFDELCQVVKRPSISITETANRFRRQHPDETLPTRCKTWHSTQRRQLDARELTLLAFLPDKGQTGGVMNRIPCVMKAEYRGGYRIHVTFDDNLEKTIDF